MVNPPLIAVIRENIQELSFHVFSAKDFSEIASFVEVKHLIHPREGWSESDGLALMVCIKFCIKKVLQRMEEKGYSVSDIKTIGITNHRDGIIAWNKNTKMPVYNIIHGDDRRTYDTLKLLRDSFPPENKAKFKFVNGQIIDFEYPILKIKWLSDNVPEFKNQRDNILIGTVDSWIMWNLTGGLHITDVSNASKTFLMNLDSCTWNHNICNICSIDMNMLPEIRSSSEIYGKVHEDFGLLQGIRISSILGVPLASLFASVCCLNQKSCGVFNRKISLLQLLPEKKISGFNAKTIVAWKLGNQNTVYAFEGTIPICQDPWYWLMKVGLLQSEERAEVLALKVPTSKSVYFVPAFRGLNENNGARAIICGLTVATTSSHIMRAGFEAICFGVCDIIEIFKNEGLSFEGLTMFGYRCSRSFFPQMQADISGLTLHHSSTVELDALGSALCAAQAVDVYLYKVVDGERDLSLAPFSRYIARNTQEERRERYKKWHKACKAALNWVVETK